MNASETKCGGAVVQRGASVREGIKSVCDDRPCETRSVQLRSAKSALLPGCRRKLTPKSEPDDAKELCLPSSTGRRTQMRNELFATEYGSGAIGGARGRRVPRLATQYITVDRRRLAGAHARVSEGSGGPENDARKIVFDRPKTSLRRT